MRRREARWPNAQRWHRSSGMDWIWRPTRLAIYARDDDRCFRCGSRYELTLDHVFDAPRGCSTNAPTNLLTMCNACNATRGATLLREFLGVEKFASALLRLEKPIDRALGRALCEKRWPGFIDANKRRVRAWAKRRKAEKTARRAA